LVAALSLGVDEKKGASGWHFKNSGALIEVSCARS